MADVSVKHLCKNYPTPTDPLVVLDDISISLAAGDNLAVVGPSGSGKSTFLHILGTLDEPTSGSIDLFGTNPFRLTEKELAHFRNQNIGFIFQEHHLLPQLSAWENVLLPALAESNVTKKIEKRAKHLLDQVGLTSRMTHRPAELSGGERQRVAVARALLQQPRLLLADEPTGSLDRKTTKQIGELLLSLQKSENLLLVCVTHNERLANCFQQTVQLDEGKFVDVTTHRQ